MQISKNGTLTIMNLSINEKTCTYKYKINLIEARIKYARKDSDKLKDNEVFLNMICFNK